MIKSGVDFGEFLKFFNTEQRTELYETFKKQFSWIIKSADDFNKLLEYLNPKQRTEVYEAFKKQLFWSIESADDLGKTLEFLNTEQRTAVFEMLNEDKNSWEPIVQNGKDFEFFLYYLNFEQQLNLCIFCEKKLNSFIYVASNENEEIYVYFDGFFYDGYGDKLLDILKAAFESTDESTESVAKVFLNRLPKNSIVLNLIVDEYVYFLSDDNLLPWQDLGNKKLQIKILQFILTSEVGRSYLTSQHLDKITSHCQYEDTKRCWDYISDREMIEIILKYAKENANFVGKIESSLFFRWAQYIRHSMCDDVEILTIPNMIFTTPMFINCIETEDLQKLKSIYQDPDENSSLHWYCMKHQLKKLEGMVDDALKCRSEELIKKKFSQPSTSTSSFFQTVSEDIDNETLADLAQLQINAKQT